MKWNVGALKKATDMVQQKKETLGDLLIKMGGDLLFHKQVQYHQRGRA
jgi:hypothetical protein